TGVGRQIIQKRKPLSEGEILTEGQQIALVVAALENAAYVREKGGVEGTLLSVHLAAREPAEQGGHVHAIIEHQVAHHARTLRDVPSEGGLGPHQQVELLGSRQGFALLKVSPQALLGIAALLEQSHVGL